VVLSSWVTCSYNGDYAIYNFLGFYNVLGFLLQKNHFLFLARHITSFSGTAAFVCMCVGAYVCKSELIYLGAGQNRLNCRIIQLFSVV